jgi:hypothetical protein
MVDARDLKSLGRKAVRVRVPPSAPIKSIRYDRRSYRPIILRGTCPRNVRKNARWCVLPPPPPAAAARNEPTALAELRRATLAAVAAVPVTVAATSLRDLHIPCPQSAIRPPEPHESHTVSDSRRQMPLNILNSDEDIRPNIGITFNEAIPESACELHANAELPFGFFGFQFCRYSAQRGAPPAVDQSWPETVFPSRRPWRWPGGSPRRRLEPSVPCPARRATAARSVAVARRRQCWSCRQQP